MGDRLRLPWFPGIAAGPVGPDNGAPCPQPEPPWIHSYILDGRLYCIYKAPDPELIREHARLGGFPCNQIRPVSGMLDPGMGQ